MAGNQPRTIYDAIAAVVEDSDDDNNNGGANPVDQSLLIDIDDDEQEDEDDDEDEYAEEDEENEDEIVVVDPPPTSLSVSNPDTEVSRVSEGEEDEEEEEREKEVDGLLCPICMEPWSNSGDHYPSCLACGHLFGMSCIKKWLGQRRNSGKCPQCNKKCTLKDVRRIYGSQVVEVDEESQKRIRFLEAKCESLVKKDKEWRKKEVEWNKKVSVWQKKEADMCRRLQELTERTGNLERTMGDLESKALSSKVTVQTFGVSSSPVCSYFAPQEEVRLDGARCFDVDESGQVLIIARRPTSVGGSHTLTKMSLFSHQEQDNMQLPPFIKAVRDLHVSSVGRLALLASMGKKLSVVSMESNNVVLDYDLPAVAWSCSWDTNNPHYAYAGLQNGMLLVFDLRQTMKPLESRNGLTCNPIHTIYSLSDDSIVESGDKRVLTASSVGLCEWNVNAEHERPSLVTETGNHEVCISLAYCPSSENVVATFRPKVEMPDQIAVSQLSQAHASPMGYHVQGSHVVIKRVGSKYQKLGLASAFVPGIRLPKSAILGVGDDKSVFASGDEATSNLVLQELPTLVVTQRLQSRHPIRDVKYTSSVKPGLLCCLSEDRMQFFSQKFL